MRAARMAMIVMAALSGAGCMSLGGSNPPRTYYVLDDAGNRRGTDVAGPTTTIPRTLLITAARANPLADARALLYARAPRASARSTSLLRGPNGRHSGSSSCSRSA